ncbi:hypothetical protein ACFT4A_07215 [Streptomyces sp. NPDC057099]|uniref:hypothetical protein n=1 Tax=Streptomyces sp. NPDC057099 TaxID=3346019 RepID=UPI00362A5E50
MTARNDNNENDAVRRDGSDGCGGAEYDGMDALMAAILGDPVPEAARRDTDYLAAHRAAATDVALLREQLTLLGDALAHGDEARVEDRGEAADPAGRTVAAGPTAGPRGAAHGAGPGAPADSAVRVLPVRARRGRPRPVSIALRGLVAAAAATVVVGMGWLVVQGGAGSGGDSEGSSAADTAAGTQHGSEDAKLSAAGYLACARIVVEGTVAEVEPVPGTGQDRVTLDVERSYKPAEGQKRVVFPMSEEVDPRLRPGDHVLIGITGGQAEPDHWSVGEKEIAHDRAWITAALPDSRTTPCP